MSEDNDSSVDVCQVTISNPNSNSSDAAMRTTTSPAIHRHRVNNISISPFKSTFRRLFQREHIQLEYTDEGLEVESVQGRPIQPRTSDDIPMTDSELVDVQSIPRNPIVPIDNYSDVDLVTVMSIPRRSVTTHVPDDDGSANHSEIDLVSVMSIPRKHTTNHAVYDEQTEHI
jgi:hypothetical protein